MISELLPRSRRRRSQALVSEGGSSWFNRSATGGTRTRSSDGLGGTVLGFPRTPPIFPFSSRSLESRSRSGRPIFLHLWPRWQYSVTDGDDLHSMHLFLLRYCRCCSGCFLLAVSFQLILQAGMAFSCLRSFLPLLAANGFLRDRQHMGIKLNRSPRCAGRGTLAGACIWRNSNSVRVTCPDEQNWRFHT